MKQSAAKTLGVSALGAAFAAVGAGAAHAAPAVPDPASIPGTVTRTLPADVPQVPAEGQDPLGGGLVTTQPVAEDALAGGPVTSATALLGGLPTHMLPTHGVPVNGIPLG